MAARVSELPLERPGVVIMPIVGWICPIERTEVPFNHFDTCVARSGRPAFNPTLARIMTRKIVGDVRHAGLQLTATRTYGCPRATFLDVAYDYYVDPTRLVAMARGTILHGVFAREADEALWYTESNDAVRMNLHGTVFGHEIDLMCDAVRRDLGEVVDFKFPLDWSVRYREQQHGRCKIEHQIQLNLARIVLGQQEWARREGYDPGNVLLTCWDFALGQGGRGGPEPLVAAHMTEEEMEAVRPFGGEWTVADIVANHVAMLEAARSRELPRAGTEQDEFAASLPLVGETQMGSSKCTKYCELEPLCSNLVRRFGRPVVQ